MTSRAFILAVVLAGPTVACDDGPDGRAHVGDVADAQDAATADGSGDVGDVASDSASAADSPAQEAGSADVADGSEVDTPSDVVDSSESTDADGIDAADAEADGPTMPPGDRVLSGRAWFFDLSDSLSIAHVGTVAGATVSIVEYPDVRVAAADDGTFALEGLPDGVELTLAVEHPDFFPTLTRTFVLDGESIVDVTFQVLSHRLAGVAAGIVGVSATDPDVCIMATTVTAISDNMGSVWAVGEPDVTVALEPAIDPEYGPIYFDASTRPDPRLTRTTTDGGVVFAGPVPGTYTWHGTKAGYTFSELTTRCVPGWLTNASPPHGLVVTGMP